MFSNLAQMAAGYPAEECGMNGCCTCYFVVGDGSVYLCDFYCLDEWKLGTVQNSFRDMILSDTAKKLWKIQNQWQRNVRRFHINLYAGVAAEDGGRQMPAG